MIEVPEKIINLFNDLFLELLKVENIFNIKINIEKRSLLYNKNVITPDIVNICCRIDDIDEKFNEDKYIERFLDPCCKELSCHI